MVNYAQSVIIVIIHEQADVKSDISQVKQINFNKAVNYVELTFVMQKRVVVDPSKPSDYKV